MKSIIGTGLRVVAVLWLINGMASFVLAFLETGLHGFLRGLVSVFLGVGLFMFGTWLKNRSSTKLGN